jgi:hypothetical protein
MDKAQSPQPLHDALATEARRIEEDATYSAKGHFEAAKRWTAWHYRIGLPTALLAAIAGVSAISEHELTATILAFLVAASSAVSTFLKPSEQATPHRDAGNAFKALQNDARFFREIDCSAALSPEELRARLEFLNTRRNDLIAKSPQIPRRAFEDARKGIEQGEAAYAVDRAR